MAQKLTVTASDDVTLNISLQADAGGSNITADWWLIAITPTGGIRYFSLERLWDNSASDLGAVKPAYQGAVFPFSNVTLPALNDNQSGSYWYFFGIDTSANSMLDMELLHYDAVNVVITGTQPPVAAGLLQPADFQYLGAFRLPGNEPRPRTFEYGGNAMTFNPDGDTANTDAYPGSLFISGHDRIAYGDLPDGSQIAEITIPVPLIADNPRDLNTAEFVQDFTNVLEGWFTDMEEIPRMAMQYLDHPDTGPKIHAAWGQHLQAEESVPSHFWFNPGLTQANVQGPWLIGSRGASSVNGYMLEIPASWADSYTGGRYLGTGRYRDGGWSGMGPNLFAYKPWTDAAGTPAAANSTLSETALISYAYVTEDITYRSMQGYQHPDEWEGSAWITTRSGKTAVLFSGTKSTGDKFWYGFSNPRGPEYPCPQAAFEGNACYLANGNPCPAEDQVSCCDEELGTCSSNRGWWSSRWNARIIFYNPDDLAKVAAGTMQSWEPQPYAYLDFDEHLFMNPGQIDLMELGTGVQRRLRIGDMAYDRANDLIYVLELFADEARPVVHVWRLN